LKVREQESFSYLRFSRKGREGCAKRFACSLRKLSFAPLCVKITRYFSTFEKITSIGMSTSGQEKELVEVLEVIETTDVKNLVVFNDDINTFDHVTSTLIRVCRHTAEQAEQCTWIIHYKGKCAVKTGSFDDLLPMKDAICDAGIDARIV
jgi:ATP-dependent Clp protease adaptor protein ClpS